MASLKRAEALRIIREIGLTAHTHRSIVDETEYLKQLENVKQKGYAFDDEEYIEGIRSLAVNLGNCRGLPLVIWVVGFTASLTLARLPILVQKTCQAAGALSRGCLTGCSTKNQQSS